MYDDEVVGRLCHLAEEYERRHGHKIDWKELAHFGLSQTTAVPVLERMLEYDESAEEAFKAVYGDAGHPSDDHD